MALDRATFEDLKPSEEQLTRMGFLREATKQYAGALEKHTPEGPDKTYLLRKLREIAMWADVAITRQPDGSPRI